MGLCLVLVKEHAGASVELGDDYTLGAVEDERAVLGHQGDVTEIDVLLLDFLRLGGVILVVDGKAHLRMERCRIGLLADLALTDGELRLVHLVAYILELGAALL